MTNANHPANHIQFHDMTREQQLEHLRTVHGRHPNSLGLMHMRDHRLHRAPHHGTPAR